MLFRLQTWKQIFTNNCLYVIKHNGLGIKASLKPSAMKDIVFCCTNCDKQIIRNSEDHDYSKCDETEEYWYCVDCPIPDEEEKESICWCPRCKELKYEGDDVCCRCGRCFEGECKHYACDCVVETDEEEEEDK